MRMPEQAPSTVAARMSSSGSASCLTSLTITFISLSCRLVASRLILRRAVRPRSQEPEGKDEHHCLLQVKLALDVAHATKYQQREVAQQEYVAEIALRLRNKLFSVIHSNLLSHSSIEYLLPLLTSA